MEYPLGDRDMTYLAYDIFDYIITYHTLLVMATASLPDSLMAPSLTGSPVRYSVPCSESILTFLCDNLSLIRAFRLTRHSLIHPAAQKPL